MWKCGRGIYQITVVLKITILKESYNIVERKGWSLGGFGLKLIQLKQQKTQLPLIILAKNLKLILCRVIKGTWKSLNWE